MCGGLEGGSAGKEGGEQRPDAVAQVLTAGVTREGSLCQNGEMDRGEIKGERGNVSESERDKAWERGKRRRT